jgi:hypothetical protein
MKETLAYLTPFLTFKYNLLKPPTFLYDGQKRQYQAMHCLCKGAQTACPLHSFSTRSNCITEKILFSPPVELKLVRDCETHDLRNFDKNIYSVLIKNCDETEMEITLFKKSQCSVPVNIGTVLRRDLSSFNDAYRNR